MHNNATTVADIDYICKLYAEQKEKVEKEEYIKNLLFEDYVETVKSNQTKYDLLTNNLFSSARAEIGVKAKKDRPHLELLRETIVEDFFNRDKKFKIREICCCGYEEYGWRVELEGHGETVAIYFPVKKNITSKNIRYAKDGKFQASIKISEASWKVLALSYETEDIARCIEEQFGNLPKTAKHPPEQKKKNTENTKSFTAEELLKLGEDTNTMEFAKTS